MRLLILSEEIERQQRFAKVKYIPPYDAHLEAGDLNSTDDFHFSAFDYDVTIVHIIEPQHHSIGYYENLPKLLRDARIALQNGRSIICLPQSSSFQSKRLNENGMRAYEWIEQLGIKLQDNVGVDIKPSGAGKAQVIQRYLEYTPQYFQIVTDPQVLPARRLAVVDDTEIVVGLEYPVDKGTLVILPPPIYGSFPHLSIMSALVDIARRYYERAQKSIPVGDSPDWISEYLVVRAKELDDHIRRLANEKAEYDKLAYILYGTGEELEHSVALLLQKLGLIVEIQPQGANIDLKAKHPAQNVGFAIEVTGTKGTIQKESTKIAQAWQYLSERSGTPEEQYSLMIVANTEYHLNPNQRRAEAFSQNVVRLLGDNGVLLITTVQLYKLWRSVYEGKGKAEDVILELHKKSGLYQI